VKFDAPRPDEYSLVYDSWARSFRKSPWAGCIPNHLYDQVSRAGIADILDRGARVVCAVQELDEGARRVMGYAVSEPNVLHWLFVKRDYRGFGVGSALLRETIRDWLPPGEGNPQWVYTHRTNASARFLARHPFVWDPVPARVKRTS